MCNVKWSLLVPGVDCLPPTLPLIDRGYTQHQNAQLAWHPIANFLVVSQFVQHEFWFRHLGNYALIFVSFFILCSTKVARQVDSHWVI